RQILGVLKRQVEKHSLDGAQGLVITRLQSFQRQLSRPGVVGEGLGSATIDVAGKLVQQQNQRQPSLRRLLPRIELSGRCLLQHRFKTFANLAIRFIVLAPPEACLAGGCGGVVRRVAEPEPEYRLNSLFHAEIAPWKSLKNAVETDP